MVFINRLKKIARNCESWIKISPPDCDADDVSANDAIYVRGSEIAEIYLFYYEGKEKPWVLEMETSYSSHYRLGEFSTQERASETMIELMQNISDKCGIRITTLKEEGEF